MGSQKFSWQKRFKSFSYAWDGIKALVRTEHNTYIHAAFTVVAILLALVLQVSAMEAMVLIIVMTLVWTAEIFNTAIEKTMDFISTEQKPQIKLVKDLAAAAVLLTALMAVVVGAIIFLPKILSYVAIPGK